MAAAAEAGAGAFEQLWTLVRALAGSPARRGIALISAGLVVVVSATAAAQIRLNYWQGAFYDALSRREVHAFFDQMLVFVAIVAVLLVLVVSQTWLAQMLKVRLRDWLTADLIERWLIPARAYRLGLAGEIGKNPDQRLHQDAQRLTELTSVLGVGLLQSSLLLVSFVGVLWALSDQVAFQIGGKPVQIPGYMVWCALLYAGGGSALAWRVGRPLVRINAGLYAREADLRFGLMRVSEAADGIALYRGEADERAKLRTLLAAVVAQMVRAARGLATLTWVTSGYGWLAIVVPVAVAAPGYFDGTLTFGTLMMVVGAFNQLQQALRWFVDNISQIADWRAALLRVMALRDALDGIEGRMTEGMIIVRRNDRPALELRGVAVQVGEAYSRITEGDLVLHRGECVAVAGEPGEGKSMVFRAIAGLWPWGTGEIRLPEPDGMLFLPNRPYLPPGTLRESVAYPANVESVSPTDARTALEAVGLGHLASELDREARWDRELAVDEQQRLAFARALLHRPAWLLSDDAGSALGPKTRRRIFQALRRELPEMAILAFERDDAEVGPFRLVHLELVADPMAPVARQSAPPLNAASGGA